MLYFRHEGLTPELECFDMCHEGWTHYLASLVSYVETGQGRAALGTAEPHGPARVREEWPPDAGTRRSTTPTSTETDAVLRALADPNRRQIIRLIQDTELPAGQIATHFTLTQQAVSQHLTVLKQAGLLDERRDGHPPAVPVPAGRARHRCATCSTSSGRTRWNASSVWSNATIRRRERTTATP